MILVLGKRLYRMIIGVLVLLLILPVLQFYVLRVLEPQTVHFREPRGQALKVSAEAETEEQDPTGISRFLQSLHEFFQNGL